MDLVTALSSWSSPWLGKLLLRAVSPFLHSAKEDKDTHRGIGTFQTVHLRWDPAGRQQAWLQCGGLQSLPAPDCIKMPRSGPLRFSAFPCTKRASVPPAFAWQLTQPEPSPRGPAEPGVQHCTAPEHAARREELLARALQCQELQLIQQSIQTSCPRRQPAPCCRSAI